MISHREYSSGVFSRDLTKFKRPRRGALLRSGAICNIANYLTPPNDDFAGRISTTRGLPNNERRASRESDKDSIVDSAVIYRCIQSRTTHGAGNDVHYMRRGATPCICLIKTAGNLSIAVLSKCPINNNLITLRPAPSDSTVRRVGLMICKI